jgi:hypothetical protein
VCPYDLFREDLRPAYTALFASASGLKHPHPACRGVSRDVAGTLSGGWFQGGSTDLHGPWLMLVSEGGVETDLVVREDAQSRYDLRDVTTPTDPSTVTVGGFVCYHAGDAYAALKLFTAESMGLVRGAGACPAQLPASGFETWTR